MDRSRAIRAERKLEYAPISRPIVRQDELPPLPPLVWPKVFQLALLHILGIWGFFLLSQMLWPTLALLLTLFFLSGFGVTAGMHRLWYCASAYWRSYDYVRTVSRYGYAKN